MPENFRKLQLVSVFSQRSNVWTTGRDECETVPRLWGPRLIAIRAVQMATRGRSLIVVHLRSLSWKSLSEGALGRRIIEYDVKVSIVLRIRAFKGARWKLGQIAINLVQREREEEWYVSSWTSELVEKDRRANWRGIRLWDVDRESERRRVVDDDPLFGRRPCGSSW